MYIHLIYMYSNFSTQLSTYFYVFYCFFWLKCNCLQTCVFKLHFIGSFFSGTVFMKTKVEKSSVVLLLFCSGHSLWNTLYCVGKFLNRSQNIRAVEVRVTFVLLYDFYYFELISLNYSSHKVCLYPTPRTQISTVGLNPVMVRLWNKQKVIQVWFQF